MELAAIFATLLGLGYLGSQKTKEFKECKKEDKRDVKTNDTIPIDVNRLYENDPSAPDFLPTVLPYYNQPDVDERNPHNYPGPPRDKKYKDIEDLGKGTTLSEAYNTTRGYNDLPNGFGPNDVTNTNNVKGIWPLIGRTAETPLYIDALEPRYFKPPKSTILQDDMRREPQKQPDVFGDKSIVGLSKDYIDPYTKFRGPAGQLDYLYPGAIPGSSKNPDYGFSNGEKFTLRTGGFHPRQRIFQMPEITRKQLYFSIRNPNFAVGRSGSIYSQGRGELGNLELPYNSYVKEYHREPLPNAGLTENKKRANPGVVLQCTTRPEQQIGWMGPRGTSDRTQETFRLRTVAETAQDDPNGKGDNYWGAYGGRDVIPNKTTQTPLWPIGNKAITETKGPQETNPVELRPTHRACFLGAINSYNDPAPNFDKGDPAVYNTEFIYNTSLKSVTDGPDVMHPPNPLLARDSIADAINNPNRPTAQESTEEFTQNQVTSGYKGDNSRINPTHLRHTQKGTGIYFAVNRPFNSDRTLAPQYTEYPKPVDRKVTPLIENGVDPSLINPYKQNPYTQQIPVTSYS